MNTNIMTTEVTWNDKMKKEMIYCPCGHALLHREDLLICTICHSVFKVQNDEIKFLGTTQGIRETRELLEVLNHD